MSVLGCCYVSWGLAVPGGARPPLQAKAKGSEERKADGSQCSGALQVREGMRSGSYMC